MQWLRSRRRFGSYLALFALGFQLVVCFGHVHFDAAAAGSTFAGNGPGTVATNAPNPASSDIPPLADDHCAICGLIQLAGSVITGEAPPLPLPIQSARAQRAISAEYHFSGASLALFRARAPPIS
jgi:hypothetical protein